MNGSKLDYFLLLKAKNILFGIGSGSLGIVAFFQPSFYVLKREKVQNKNLLLPNKYRVLTKMKN